MSQKTSNEDKERARKLVADGRKILKTATEFDQLDEVMKLGFEALRLHPRSRSAENLLTTARKVGRAWTEMIPALAQRQEAMKSYHPGPELDPFSPW